MLCGAVEDLCCGIHSSNALNALHSLNNPAHAALPRQVLRHASKSSGSKNSGSKSRHHLIVFARADVAWPRTFDCISPAALRASSSALTFSCQVVTSHPHTPALAALNGVLYSWQAGVLVVDPGGAQ